MCVIWEKLAHCKVIYTKYYESSNQINLELLLFVEQIGPSGKWHVIPIFEGRVFKFFMEKNI